MNRFRLLRIGLLALSIVSAPPGFADGFPELSDAQAVLETAAATDLERYPDADTLYLFSAERARYEADGLSVSYSESWIKVLTEKGRRERSVFSFGFNEAYGGVEVPLAEIHRADGTVSTVDVAAQSRVMIAPDQMHKNIYDPRQKVLRLGIPGLEIGDTVRIRSIRRQTKTRMTDTWSDFTVFEAPVPLLHAVYEVDAPAERPLVNRLLKGEIPGTVVYEEEAIETGGVRHRWIARDVPRLFEEPAMPDWWTVAQRLLVSTIPDWETVSRWYWNLSLPRLESTTPAMEEKVRELTEGLADRQAQIEAIFRFVSQQVRYMGITTEEEAPGYEPRDVHVTFENLYGVCRDKAALLVALLRIAGFEAFPVLIHVGPRKDAEVPQPFFNHAIVAVREPDGSYQLMDMTDETTRDLLPTYLANLSYLVATPEGETLLTSPVPPASENLARIDTEATLSADGRLTGTTRIRLDGINDNAYRGYFASVKPAERRRFFEGLIKRVLPGAELVSFALSPADMQDISQPIEVTLDFAVPDYPVAEDTAVLLPPPWFGTSIGMVNFILRQTGLRERRFPLRTRYACGVEERFTLRLEGGPGFAPVSVPAYPALERETLSWNQSLRFDNGRLEGAASFLLHAPEFDPEEYIELRSVLGDIEFNRRKWPILSPAGRTDPETPTEADVSYAFRSAEIEWESETSWIETRRLRKTVLTYAGIKDHSEVILPFNPAWEEVELLEARVTAPDGVVSEAREEEINLMDAAWVGAAPRYPAGRVLVVNLPAVQVGSTIDVTTRRRRFNRPFFSFRESFGGIEPVGRMDVAIDAPRDALPGAQMSAYDGRIDVEEEATAGDRVRRRWSHTAPVLAAREDDLPPDWVLFPSLFLSAGDWEAYAADVERRLREAAEAAEQAAREAQRITADLATPGERLRAIRDFVARRVRDAGPTFIQLPLDALSAADRTLDDGYGHSADRAILLFAMLRAAGFDPSFTLASRWPEGSAVAGPLDSTPQRDLFSSVLVRVEIDGSVVYLNDTDQYAEPGSTSNDGNLGMRLPGGIMERIRAAEGKERGTEVEYRVRLGSDGEAGIDILRRFRGTAHAATRRRFDEMTPEDRRRYHQEAVTAVSQRAEPDGELLTDFSRYPGEERFSVTIDRFAVREGDLLYLHLPGAGTGLPIRADHRAHPIWWDARNREELVHVVHPPEGARIALAPQAQSWNLPGGAISVARQVHAPAGPAAGWRMETVVERAPGQVEPVFYPALIEVHRRLSHPRNRLLAFDLSVPAAATE